MPDERLSPASSTLSSRPQTPTTGGSTSSPFLSLPNADLGTFPLAEFRSFPAWVAFAFGARFTGAPFGLAWPGAAWGAIGEEREGRTWVGGSAGFPSHPG